MDFLTLYNAGLGYAYPYGSSTLATSTYSPQYYNYDALGNFATKGTNRYTYAQTGDANPDAPAQIANESATSAYGYDDQDMRVWHKEGNTKTIFPSALYNVICGTPTATTTKHIMVGDLPVATVENVGTTMTSTTTAVITKRFAVTDRLGSVSAMLTASGTVAEMLDVYPFGGVERAALLEAAFCPFAVLPDTMFAPCRSQLLPPSMAN
jgi:hypothetical protein